MLTSDLVKPCLRQEGQTLTVAWIDEHDPHWLQTASELINLFQSVAGQTLATWYSLFESYEGDRLDYPVLRGLAKVLTDAATFTQRQTSIDPVVLRKRLFASGPVYYRPDVFQPLTRQDRLETIVKEENIPLDEVEATLYADKREALVLTDVGPTWSPQQLLARYNLELARATLYWAIRIQVEVEGGYKDLFKYIKLFKLMYYAKEKTGGGYQLDLAGPLSPFVSTTTRYGRVFGAWLPALFLCDRWHLKAYLRSPLTHKSVTYELDSSTCPLQSSFHKSGSYDSRLEADFAAEFADKCGESRGAWTLKREDQILLLGETVMIPDFTFVHRHDEQRRVLVEIVGFWTETYLRRKVQKIREANCPHLLLLVYEGINLTPEKLRDIPGEVMYFQRKPVLKDVMAAVERIALQVYGDPPAPRRGPEPLSIASIVHAYTDKPRESEEEWLTLPQLKVLLTQLEPAFTPRRCGYKDLSHMLRENATLFEVRRRAAKGRPIEVRFLP